MKSVSGQWADFIQGVTATSVPPRVLEHAKVRMLDVIGTGLAARGLKVPELARAFVKGSSGPATVVGHAERVAVIDAALVNATLMNGRSEDDFLRKSHPGALTIPGALAVAEAEGRDGAAVLAGVIAGYEIVGRAFMGAPGMLPKFRASGVAGTVGAAAAAARLYGLDIATTMNALGASACFAHGFGQGFVSGTTEVKLNVGMASRQGVSAAMLAKLGATASAVAFEGDVGYFRAFNGGSLDDLEAATSGLGETWLIEETVFKECPICIFTQTPVALARELASRVVAGEVERITLTAPDLTYTNPGFLNDKPYRTHLQAAISAKFCTAAALLGKPVESYELYDQLDEPEVLALSEKIELVNRPGDRERLDLEVVQKNGTLRASGLEHDTLFPTNDKVLSKFRRLTAPLPIDTERVIAVVMELEKVDDIRVLTDLLRTSK